MSRPLPTSPFFDSARIGHNRGPALDGGSPLAIYQWRRVAAGRRKPSGMVLKMRVARAAELGMTAADFLAIHAFTGRDPSALAFTPEALRLRLARRLDMPAPVRARLAALQKIRLLCFSPPGEDPEGFREELSALAGVAFAACAPLPEDILPWARARDAARALLDPLKLTGAAVLLVGEGAVATQLYQAGKLGCLLPPEKLFG